MAIVGVTSELLVVLGFWAIYFRDKDEQRGSSPTIDDYLKAPAPIRGCRPTVEFTLMPQGFSKSQLLQAGFQAGYPVNPFKSYSHAYTMLYSQ